VIIISAQVQDSLRRLSQLFKLSCIPVNVSPPTLPSSDISVGAVSIERADFAWESSATRQARADVLKHFVVRPTPVPDATPPLDAETISKPYTILKTISLTVHCPCVCRSVLDSSWPWSESLAQAKAAFCTPSWEK
jgi:hypothetical protein